MQDGIKCDKSHLQRQTFATAAILEATRLARLGYTCLFLMSERGSAD